MFSEMYKHAIGDEQLLRLLFYVAEHRDDDVTIETDARPNINGDFDVINSVVKLRKRKDGDFDGNRSNFCLSIQMF